MISDEEPICYRFPSLSLCGCTIPCRIAVPSVELQQLRSVPLFVGPIQAAYKAQALQVAGVTHVLDASGEEYAKRTDLFTYKSIYVPDHCEADIIGLFPETNAFIEEGLAAGGAVLVHCRAGISRSVTLVVAYLVWKDRVPVDVALEWVRAARPIANPNAGFMKQLRDFETMVWRVI